MSQWAQEDSAGQPDDSPKGDLAVVADLHVRFGDDEDKDKDKDRDEDYEGGGYLVDTDSDDEQNRDTGGDSSGFDSESSSGRQGSGPTGDGRTKTRKANIVRGQLDLENTDSSSDQEAEFDDCMPTKGASRTRSDSGSGSGSEGEYDDDDDESDGLGGFIVDSDEDEDDGGDYDEGEDDEDDDDDDDNDQHENSADASFEDDGSPPRKTVEPKKKQTKPTSSATKASESIEWTSRDIKKFKASRQELTCKAYSYFNQVGFQNQLPADLEIVWSKRLLTTAGQTRLRGTRSVPVASIELSEKVLDCEERLQSTLLHEMCHAAAWLLDGQSRPPHGSKFWKWAKHSTKYLKGMEVDRCHAYKIYKPFRWQCSNIECGKTYSRHTKKGIDTARQACGHCRSSLQFLGSFTSEGTVSDGRINCYCD